MSRKDAIRETTATIEVKEKPHRSEAKLMLLREILELRRVFNADERKPEDHILSNRYACGKFHPPEPGAPASALSQTARQRWLEHRLFYFRELVDVQWPSLRPICNPAVRTLVSGLQS